MTGSKTPGRSHKSATILENNTDNPGNEYSRILPIPLRQNKMATETCGRIVFHSRPGVDNPPTESNFAAERIEIPRCKEGEILVKTLYLSVDPYMRCRMNEDTGAAYLTPWALGEPPAGGGVGKVVQSRSKRFGEGDIVESAVWPWQEFVVFSGENPYLNKVGPHTTDLASSVM